MVVLGGSGMLGHKLFQVLRQRFPGTMATVRASVREPPLDRVALLQGPDVIPGVDAIAFDSLSACLRDLKPHVVVNCLGIIKQRDEAADPVASITINSLLPHRLAGLVAEWNGRLIHFSTDCVFSGRSGHYRETDPSDAGDLYGRSKSLGEVTAGNSVTLRTSIIGRELCHHRSLLDWLLSQNGRTVRGYRRAIYSGITTIEMADVVTRIVREWPELSGLFQVVSEPISKYDLLVLLKQAYELDVAIEPDDRDVCDRSMCGDRFCEATGWRAPAWPKLVARLAADDTPYAEWGIRILEDTRLEPRDV